MTDITPAHEPSTQAVDTGKQMWNYATALSRATIIPKAYQGQPANCFVALDMANRLRVGVMEIMQNTFVVHGTPGFSAKYVIAQANRSGVFKGPIQFETTGRGTKNLSVRAYATVTETGQEVEFIVDMKMAEAEGWTKNPKYRTMPELMCAYRSATLLVRLYCPQVLLGLSTSDELEDVSAARTADFDLKMAQLNEPETASESPSLNPDADAVTDVTPGGEASPDPDPVASAGSELELGF